MLLQNVKEKVEKEVIDELLKHQEIKVGAQNEADSGAESRGAVRSRRSGNSDLSSVESRILSVL